MCVRIRFRRNLDFFKISPCSNGQFECECKELARVETLFCQPVHQEDASPCPFVQAHQSSSTTCFSVCGLQTTYIRSTWDAS